MAVAVALDEIVEVAGCRVAALAEIASGAHSGPGWGFARIAKRPVAVLISDGGEVRAFDADGAPMMIEAVERLCPGAWAAVIGKAT